MTFANGTHHVNTRGYDMARTSTTSKSGPNFGPKLALLASAAIASLALSGCTTASAPRAEVSYDKAQPALNKGQAEKAIAYAEAAVLAAPRDAEYRALLATAYLEAGRYESAALSFGDALELGHSDPRTVLSYALTKSAIGENKVALEELSKWESSLDPADAGLALALAGNPERGVFVLTNALRAGQNTPKLRQNLAYTYALAGNWRAARVMAAEDVPADQLDKRISDWAKTARPEDQMVRVTKLVGISPTYDSGMPGHLALSNFPSTEQLLAEAEKEAEMEKAALQVAEAPGQSGEARVEPVEVADTVAAVMTKAETPVAVPSPKPTAAASAVAQPVVPTFTYVSRPVTQPLPEASANDRAAKAPKATPKRVASAPKGDSHLVQLGSYDSEVEAKRGWTTLKSKFPELAAHDVVITQAEVKGKTYYRVAAAGFGRRGAQEMCSTVRSAGRGCFAYAKSNPPKGAVAKGTRIAAAR